MFKKFLGRPGGWDDLQAALALVPAEAEAGTDGLSTAEAAARAEILLEMAPFGITARDRAYDEEALALARRSGAVRAEVNALLSLAVGATAPAFQAAPGSEALALIARARAIAARRGQIQAVIRAAVLESHLLEAAGEHERSAEVAREACARRRRTAHPPARHVPGLNVAESLLRSAAGTSRWSWPSMRSALRPLTLYQSALAAETGLRRAGPRRPAEAAAEALSAARQAAVVTASHTESRTTCRRPRLDGPGLARAAHGAAAGLQRGDRGRPNITTCRAPPDVRVAASRSGPGARWSGRPPRTPSAARRRPWPGERRRYWVGCGTQTER